jgi:hypothetical protein
MFGVLVLPPLEVSNITPVLLMITRFCWIYLLKHKSDVEHVLYPFQAYAERLLSSKFKVVHFD